MPVGAAIGVSGALGAGASLYAANTQANSATSALNLQQGIYDKNYNMLSPYAKTGSNAFSSLAQFYGLGPNGKPDAQVQGAWDKFTSLPAYQFPLQQGQLALTRSLNAQGLNMSGAQLKEITGYGEGLAGQYLGQYMSGLQGMANTGVTAGSALAGVGASMGNSMASTTLAQGAYGASGVMGAANSLAGGLNNLAMYSMLAKNPGGAGVSGASSPTYSLSGPMNVTPYAPNLSNYAPTMGGTGGMY